MPLKGKADLIAKIRFAYNFSAICAPPAFRWRCWRKKKKLAEIYFDAQFVAIVTRMMWAKFHKIPIVLKRLFNYEKLFGGLRKITLELLKYTWTFNREKRERIEELVKKCPSKDADQYLGSIEKGQVVLLEPTSKIPNRGR